MITTYALTLMILALTGVIQGSLFHPSNGFEYSQRTSKPTTYIVNIPFYQRIAAALTALNSNGAHHHSTGGCILSHHSHDPEQGEVVQSAAYPHVAQYHPIYPPPTQFNPVVYSPSVAYNQQLPYNVPVAYHQQGPINRIRHRTLPPQVNYPLTAFPPLEGVPSSVDYGGYHYPAAYAPPPSLY